MGSLEGAGRSTGCLGELVGLQEGVGGSVENRGLKISQSGSRGRGAGYARVSSWAFPISI